MCAVRNLGLSRCETHNPADRDEMTTRDHIRIVMPGTLDEIVTQVQFFAPEKTRDAIRKSLRRMLAAEVVEYWCEGVYYLVRS